MNKNIYELGKMEFIKNDQTMEILYDIAFDKGQELAIKLNADKEVVAYGMALIDYKIVDAIAQGKVINHIQMSHDAAANILSEDRLNQASIDNILHCIDAHHGTIPYQTIEAQICANADCYKFIHPKGFFAYLTVLSKRAANYDDIIKQAELKLDEKFKIISLDIVRQELEPIYYELKKMISMTIKD